MNKEKILEEILANEELKAKYWPKVDINKLNVNTLSKERNKFLTALQFLFEENNQVKFAGMINDIKKTFEL